MLGLLLTQVDGDEEDMVIFILKMMDFMRKMMDYLLKTLDLC